MKKENLKKIWNKIKVITDFIFVLATYGYLAALVIVDIFTKETVSINKWIIAVIFLLLHIVDKINQKPTAIIRAVDSNGKLLEDVNCNEGVIITYDIEECSESDKE